MLKVNIFYTFFFCSNVDFEDINDCWKVVIQCCYCQVYVFCFQAGDVFKQRPYTTGCIENSGKFVVLKQIIDNCCECGDKLLVFR